MTKIFQRQVFIVKVYPIICTLFSCINNRDPSIHKEQKNISSLTKVNCKIRISLFLHKEYVIHAPLTSIYLCQNL